MSPVDQHTPAERVVMLIDSLLAARRAAARTPTRSASPEQRRLRQRLEALLDFAHDADLDAAWTRVVDDIANCVETIGATERDLELNRSNLVDRLIGAVRRLRGSPQDRGLQLVHRATEDALVSSCNGDRALTETVLVLLGLEAGLMRAATRELAA